MATSFRLLVEVARKESGLTFDDFAKSIGLSPKTLLNRMKDGNPNLDTLIRLSMQLRLTVGDLVRVLESESILNFTELETDARDSVEELSQLENVAIEAYDREDFLAASKNFRRCAVFAERIKNYKKAAEYRRDEVDAWLRHGRPDRAIEAARLGLALPQLRPALRRRLSVNLATASFDALDRLGAVQIANSLLVDRCPSIASRDNEAVSQAERVDFAHAYLIRGHAQLELNELAHIEDFRYSPLGTVRDLESAERRYRLLAQEAEADPLWEANADICQGALIEARVHAGVLSYDQAIACFMKKLEQSTNIDALPSAQLEVLAWWLCRATSLASIGPSDQKERLLAIFIGKALDILERLHREHSQLWPVLARILCYETREVVKDIAADRHQKALLDLMIRFPFLFPEA